MMVSWWWCFPPLLDVPLESFRPIFGMSPRPSHEVSEFPYENWCTSGILNDTQRLSKEQMHTVPAYITTQYHSIAYHIVSRKHVEICWVVQHAQRFHSLRWRNKKPSLWHNRTAAAPRAASLESHGATWSGYFSISPFAIPSGNQWQWECHGISPNMNVLMGKQNHPNNCPLIWLPEGRWIMMD